MKLFGYYSRHWMTVIIFSTMMAFHLWALFQSDWRRKYKPLIIGHMLLLSIATASSILPSLRALDFYGGMDWFRGLVTLSGLTSVAMIAAATLLRYTSPDAKLDIGRGETRRQFLRTTQTAIVAAPAAVSAFAVITRNRYEVKEVTIKYPGLPKELNGLKMVQLSDIHMGRFVSGGDVERVVDAANEMRPHIALITGDQITGPRDPVEECLRHLARLRTDAGIWGCLGNHEVYAQCEHETERIGARCGIRFLRQANEIVRFGQAKLNLAGVDYQIMSHPYLTGAEKLVVPDAYNVLLSHNPDVFPTAAKLGFDLTTAGHTHGGQVTVEILHQWANVARFYTPFVSGEYRLGNSSLYVTRGIGTVGVPARLGAPPEITVLRLCAT